jgi:hypothetical protein
VDRFDSAARAVRSMMPAFRVGINAVGDVRVVQVRPSTTGDLDDTITGAQWQDKTTTDMYWRGGVLTDASGRPKGSPVVDGLTPEMLTGRVWWYR